MNSDDNKYTSGGMLKTALLGDDINRRYILAKTVTEKLPGFGEYYNQISEAAAGITYGKYSFLLHLCYAGKLEELKQHIEKLITSSNNEQQHTAA